MKVLNQLINLIWTALAYFVLMYYWYKQWDLSWFSACILLSIFLSFFPVRFYRLSKSTGFYIMIGIRVIRKFVQDGDFINRYQQGTGHRSKLNKNDYHKYLNNALMYERYHLLCLWFFTFSNLLAWFNGFYFSACLMLLSNTIYNFYPIMLQQYNRIRINRLMNRGKD